MPMSKTQHLLNKLADEGLEVAQAALKTQLFGKGEVMPGQSLNNFERVHAELDDLMAAIEMLNEECGFGYTQNRNMIEAKKQKVLGYMQFSINLGQTEGVVTQSDTHAANANAAHLTPSCPVKSNFENNHAC